MEEEDAWIVARSNDLLKRAGNEQPPFTDVDSLRRFASSMFVYLCECLLSERLGRRWEVQGKILSGLDVAKRAENVRLVLNSLHRLVGVDGHHISSLAIAEGDLRDISFLVEIFEDLFSQVSGYDTSYPIPERTYFDLDSNDQDSQILNISSSPSLETSLPSNSDTSSHYDTASCQYQSPVCRQQVAPETRRQRYLREHAERVRILREQRMLEDMQREARSRRIRRESELENMLRKLYDDSVKLEHERLAYLGRLAREKAQREASKAMDRFESAQRYMEDQWRMQREVTEAEIRRVQEERIEEHKEIRRVAKDLGKAFKLDLDKMRDKLDAQDERSWFLNQEAMKKAFHVLQAKNGLRVCESRLVV